MQFHTTGIVLAALTVVSAASAQSTQAVEWKVSEGGNGHWYKAITYWGVTYDSARMTPPGAHLASIGTAAEWNFLKTTFPAGACWAGGEYRCESGVCRWAWSDGTPWGFEAWNPGEPDSASSDERLLVVFGSQATWFDYLKTHSAGALYEYDEDCNGDGIVDYGQLQNGDLLDSNGNWIPDVCESVVAGVLPVSGPAQGGTQISITGSNFPVKVSVLIGGISATSVTRVSSTRITAVTPANLPGVSDVRVNEWTAENAFYYRPECGSDLDQNGVVDAGDISIILLDFGPCYQTPLTAPATEVPPLLDPQALPDAPRQR